ncbi:WXG100 family type VII secretion target [Nonomuraea sp. NPDC049607]|uniref:WXG100 family type VII secretion target n=1 Tax=Nonomuraea sp. NPDC049607 TaxID=3154732 RepID=UPI003432F2B6
MAGDLTADHAMRPAGSVSFSVNTHQSVAAVKDLITELTPQTLETAAATYRMAADRLTSMNETLVSGATQMAKYWEGASSVEAQQSLRTLHATIRELAAKFRAMSGPLEGLAKRLKEHQNFVNHKFGAWSQSDGRTWDDDFPGVYMTMDKGLELGSQNHLAGQHLRLLNNDLRKVFEELPASLRKVVPDLKPPTVPAADEGPGGEKEDYKIDPTPYKDPGGDPRADEVDFDDITSDDTGPSGVPDDTLDTGGGSPESGTDVPGTDGRDPDGTYPGVAGSGGSGPDGVDRTGAYPSGGAGPDTAAGTPGMGGLPDVPGSKTTLEDFQRPAGWGSDTSVPKGGSPNPFTGTGSGNGTGVGVGGNLLTGPGGLPLTSRSASAIGSGMPFMPMSGGGAHESEDKENSTWLHEDDDVWGNDPGDAVSGRIG